MYSSPKYFNGSYMALALVTVVCCWDLIELYNYPEPSKVAAEMSKYGAHKTLSWDGNAYEVGWLVHLNVATNTYISCS